VAKKGHASKKNLLRIQILVITSLMEVYILVPFYKEAVGLRVEGTYGYHVKAFDSIF
jgi:hypothetical protein